MKKTILIITTLALGVSWGRTWQIKPSGGDFTTIQAAISGSAALDSFIIDFGGHSHNETSKIYPKRRQTFVLVAYDTIKSDMVDLFECTGDSITIKGSIGSCITYTDNAASGRWLFNFNSYGGHKIDSVNWNLGTVNATGKYGIKTYRTNATIVTEPSYITDCNFYNDANCEVGLTNMATDVHMTRCKMFGPNNRFVAGTKWEIRYCAQYSPNEVRISGDSGVIDHFYLNHKYSGGEGVSTDDATVSGSVLASLKGWKFNYIIIDSAGHNDFVIDGLDSSKISNYFRTREKPTISIGPFYLHTSYQADSLHYLIIENCVLDGYPGLFATSEVPPTWPSDRMVFRNVIAMNAGAISTPNIANDTVDGVVWGNPNPTVSGLSLVKDTTVNVTLKSFMIDSIKYPFVRGNVDSTINPLFNKAGRWSGRSAVYRHLITAANAHNDTITLTDSLSSEYWFDDPINKEVAKITACIQPENGSWARIDSFTNVLSGTKSTFNITGLSSGNYNVMTIADGDGVIDTTKTFSLTVTSSGGGTVDTAKISWSFPSNGKLAGGDTLDITGIGFGSNPAINIGTIITHGTNLIQVLTPSHAAGATNFIVTPQGGVPDTVVFTYEDSRAFDSIFVDCSLSVDSTTAYNKTTKTSTGGSYKAYKKLDYATKMVTGDKIYIRAGTYTGFARLYPAQNGSSWQEGRYNLISNYNGEKVVFDGTNQYSLCMGDSGTSPELAAQQSKYWYIKGLEIKNYRASVGYPARAIRINHGPFIIDSCNIHDNYETVNVGSQNSAAITGYFWKRSTIKNSRFKNNAGLIDSSGTHNCSDIQCFSDYRSATTIQSGYLNVERSRAVMENTIDRCLFEGGSYVAVKWCKGEQLYRSGSQLVPIIDDFKYWHNDIKNNIFKGNQIGCYITTDYTNIYNNIFDSVYAGVKIPDGFGDYSMYKCIAYNNTFKNVINVAITAFSDNADFAEQIDNYYGYLFNNLVDSGMTYDQMSEFVYLRPTLNTTWKFDSVFISNNLSFRQNRSTFLTMGIEGDVYNLSTYNSTFSKSATHYTVASGNLYQSEYIPYADFAVDGSHTISNGGIGGNHPYLSGVTLPSYIGAVDPANSSWVGHVLALDSLGSGSNPEPVNTAPTITSEPSNQTVIAGGTATFTISASGTSPLRYVWYNAYNDSVYNQATFSIITSVYTENAQYYCVVSNTYGADTSTTATLTVTARVLTSISVSPSYTKVLISGQKQFSAVGLDQTGTALVSQPTFTWTLTGSGTLLNGLYTASDTTGGPYTITASSGGKSGSGSVLVVLKISSSKISTMDTRGSFTSKSKWRGL